MKPETVDSTKQILPMMDVVINAVYRGDQDIDGKKDPAKVLVALAAEFNMDDVEVIQFGNTVFVGHYAEDNESVFLRALNIDTSANYLDNTENYIAHLLRRGVNRAVSMFRGHQIQQLFQMVKRRIEKNNPSLKFKLEFNETKTGQIVAQWSWLEKPKQ